MTLLLNKEGYMCCLGQVCQQAGINKKNLLDIQSPNVIQNQKELVPSFLKNSFITKAIGINDNHTTSINKKEKQLKELFKKSNVDLVFKDSKKGQKMVRKQVEVTVRGVNRRVYLSKQLSQNKWRAQVYVDDNGRRTSVSGTYSVNANGVKRFTPSAEAVNSYLL